MARLGLGEHSQPARVRERGGPARQVEGSAQPHLHPHGPTQRWTHPRNYSLTLAWYKPMLISLLLLACHPAKESHRDSDTGGPWRTEAVPAEDLAVATVKWAGYDELEEGVRYAFGNVVSSTDDLDGDSVRDILIGQAGSSSPGYPNTLYVMSASARGNLSTDAALASLITHEAFDHALYFQGNGDLDGDGHDDYVVGDSLLELGYVIRGGVTGVIPPDNIISTLTFQRDICEGDSNALSVLVNDISGDAIDDLVVSCWALPDRTDYGPADYLGIFFGPLEPQLTSWNASILVFHQGSDVAGFGRRPAWVGDVSGDGVPEIAVLARHDDRWPGGGLFLVSGSESGQVNRWDLDTVLVGSSFDYPGTPGDVNQDGYHDLTYTYVSEEGHPVVGVALGPFRGIVQRSEVQVAAISDEVPIHYDFLEPSSRGEDLDGDGWTDVLVYAYQNEGYGQSYEGRFAVVHGPLEGSIDLKHYPAIASPHPDDYPLPLVLIDDIDGDGLPDLAYSDYRLNTSHSNDEKAVYLIPGTAL